MPQICRLLTLVRWSFFTAVAVNFCRGDCDSGVVQVIEFVLHGHGFCASFLCILFLFEAYVAFIACRLTLSFGLKSRQNTNWRIISIVELSWAYFLWRLKYEKGPVPACPTVRILFYLQTFRHWYNPVVWAASFRKENTKFRESTLHLFPLNDMWGGSVLMRVQRQEEDNLAIQIWGVTSRDGVILLRGSSRTAIFQCLIRVTTHQT